jgi:Na+-transporting NADH:ubiquinone oxidoreductase subunit A
MSKVIKIKKGLDIRLVGEAERVTTSPEGIDTVLICPPDFHGLTPKVSVSVGDEVKAGSPLFFDKNHPEVLFCSPVSGEVVEVNRGEKRKLLSIKILADKEISYLPLEGGNPDTLSREDIIARMCTGGVWPLIRQRPFDIIANPADKPKSIFISAFDSSPLGPDNDFVVHGCGNEFQTGLNALAKLAPKVHLNVHAEKTKSDIFLKAKNVQINTISGPHPSGNVGIQIHHIDPINKGDVVWFCTPQDVVMIGRLFNEGKHNATRIYALTGSELTRRRYAKSVIGAPVKPLLEGNVSNDKPLRYISGNVLTGKHISEDGYFNYYSNQLTVIPEGYESEFFGWLLPGFNKFSLSHTFFSWMMPSKQYTLDTNKHGEERAFVVTGEYEKVLPMDIYPVYLLKSILANDLEQMEKLGIYEVAPEDFALCEFVCTSKIHTQEIIRQGLDLVMEEMM